MKKLALILSFVALSAHAEVVITGGFGTDGASGESMPTARSVKDASAVYKALAVKADARDKKVIEIADGSTFECEKPTAGISRISAGCQITLRAAQNGKVMRVRGLEANLTFSGKLATKIHAALPADTSGRVGASSKSVANLSCTKAVRPGVEASCTITSTNAIAMDVKI
ncbi:MAG: hypothetical protein ACJ749_18790 [Flavisolibacter sp.]